MVARDHPFSRCRLPAYAPPLLHATIPTAPASTSMAANGTLATPADGPGQRNQAMSQDTEATCLPCSPRACAPLPACAPPMLHALIQTAPPPASQPASAALPCPRCGGHSTIPLGRYWGHSTIPLCSPHAPVHALLRECSDACMLLARMLCCVLCCPCALLRACSAACCCCVLLRGLAAAVRALVVTDPSRRSHGVGVNTNLNNHHSSLPQKAPHTPSPPQKPPSNLPQKRATPDKHLPQKRATPDKHPTAKSAMTSKPNTPRPNRL
jgi:hypothetical protein